MFLDVRTDRMSSYRWFNETNQSLLYRWVGPFQSGALSSSATNSYIPLSHTKVKWRVEGVIATNALAIIEYKFYRLETLKYIYTARPITAMRIFICNG